MPSNITITNNNIATNDYKLNNDTFNISNIKHVVETSGFSPDKIIYKNEPVIFSCTNNTDIMRYLINHGADVNLINNEGNTLLHIVTLNGSETQTFMLIEAGANVNFINSSGITAIQRAVAYGNNTIVKAIIKAGGDPYLGKSSGVYKTMTSYMANSQSLTTVVFDALQQYTLSLKETEKKINDEYNKMVNEDVNTFLSNMKLVVQI